MSDPLNIPEAEERARRCNPCECGGPADVLALAALYREEQRENVDRAARLIKLGLKMHELEALYRDEKVKREAAEEKYKLLWNSDAHEDVRTAQELYREAVEALERISAIEADPTIFPAYSSEKPKRMRAAIESARVLLAKARTALEASKPE